MSHPYDRSTFRIQYPERVRPELVLREGTRPVVDVSEHGLRYQSAGEALPEIGTEVEGLVRFRQRADDVHVRGVVIRCQGGQVAIRLEVPGLPRATLFAEQRFLWTRYPHIFRRSDG